VINVHYVLDIPRVEDGAKIHQLIAECPPLDLNSGYAYLLQASHFAETCRVARPKLQRDVIAAYVSGYRLPDQLDTLFIWQVAVAKDHRGHGLATDLLQDLLLPNGKPAFRYLQTTISPFNSASIALFNRLAIRANSKLQSKPFYSSTLFGAVSHADEDLYSIGPL
jgi:L-2,4-diaminobutyric acid acetyltransferase